VDALKRQFEPVNSEKLARDKLAALRQERSARDYIHQFRTLVLEIPNISPEEVMDRFTRGLKPNIRKEIELRPSSGQPFGFDEACALAERQDALYYRVMRPSYASMTRGPSPMELGAMSHRLERRRLPPRPRLAPSRPYGQNRRRTPQPGERNSDSRSGSCFFCHKPGHRIATCPERAKSNTVRPTLQR
jgi:hypothetical protein